MDMTFVLLGAIALGVSIGVAFAYALHVNLVRYIVRDGERRLRYNVKLKNNA